MRYPLNDFQKLHSPLVPNGINIETRYMYVDTDTQELVIEDYGEIELLKSQMEILLKGGV